MSRRRKSPDIGVRLQFGRFHIDRPTEVGRSEFRDRPGAAIEIRRADPLRRKARLRNGVSGLFVSSNGMPSDVICGTVRPRPCGKMSCPAPSPMPFRFKLKVPGARFTTSAKSEVGAMKFLIEAVLISVRAVRASSELPAGAVSVASETDSCTDTDCDTESTKSVIDISGVPVGVTGTSVRVFLAKPLDVVSTVYVPAASPVTAKCPLASLAARAAPRHRSLRLHLLPEQPYLPGRKSYRLARRAPGWALRLVGIPAPSSMYRAAADA